MVETHLTLPSLRDGPLPLPPQAGGEGHFGERFAVPQKIV
jgi:hypothetical protein